MPKLGEHTGTRRTLPRSFKVLATIIGYRMDQHPSARSCTSRGASSCEAVPTEPSMNLYIHSTTGTRFELSLPQEETVDGLKRRLSQRLKVPRERLALLHKETRLSSGKLQDLGISDGSKLTLVPTVEAGLMSQASRPEQSVMQALESLTETQVSDFLSGRSPLTLALRVGDHMMFVQLQLAAQQSGGPQLQHRHLITRGGAETAAAAAGGGGGSPTGQPARVPHPHPHSQHAHSHPGTHPSQPHLVPSSSPSPPASPSFPLPSTHHQPLPPMYHQTPSSSSAHCSPPTPPPHSPHPAHAPGGLFRSPASQHHHHHHYQQPSSSPPSHHAGQASPVAPALCPEANCSTNSPSGATSANSPSGATSPNSIPTSPSSPTSPTSPSSPSSPSGASSPSTRSRKPGAIIESFVNHAPGVFSGTFSGTLHPNCQDSTGRPRRDIGTILQILNDLLSATRHYQGMPPSLTQLRYQTQCGGGAASAGSSSPASSASPSPSPSPPPSPQVAGVTGLSAKATSVPAASMPSTTAPPPPTLHPLVQCQSQIRMCKPPGDRVRQTENRATRCKVERLQVLMQQKRLRRKARRDQRAPYQWLPNRKAGRSNSNSSLSSEGSMDLDFDDSVWKPDVKADLKSEFVMA